MAHPVEHAILGALSEMVRSTRGTTIVVWPKKIARRAGISPKPVALTVISHILKKFEEEGHIQNWSTGKKRWKRRRYKLDRGTPLWDYLLHHYRGSETANEILQRLTSFDPPYK